MTDRDYMLRAIELAKRGRGFVNPNPLVGAVIVKDGRIIGEGYHECYGKLHAERNAIASLSEPAEGATLYVTLEPCCHYGKTPPCTEAILEEKIAKVIIGSRDPNPKVEGKGAEILRNAGVRVTEDFLREECDRLNPVFFHYITTKLPYVVMKYAMTADGKIATKTGASKWITGEEARLTVQKLRHSYMGIMAGIGTVLADDPMLNVRVDGLKSPVRIICDSNLRIPIASRIVQTAREYETIVACAFPYVPCGEAGAVKQNFEVSDGEEESAKQSTGDLGLKEFYEKQKELSEHGVRVVNFPGEDGHVDLRKLMQYLGEQGIDSILLEGGGGLNESALRAGIVNEAKVFVAPKIFGGERAKTPVTGEGVSFPSEAYEMELEDVSKIGEDILLEYRVLSKAL